MLETFFQNPTQQTLVKYDQIVTQINDLDATFSSLSDEQLQDHTRLHRYKYREGLAEFVLKISKIAYVGYIPGLLSCPLAKMQILRFS